MGNIATKLSEIAKANCAVTYSFGNGRDFPSVVPTLGYQMEPRLVSQAFNNDLTDCVEVFTPFSAFSHLGNGQGLFRSAKSLMQPYFGNEELSPLMLKAILQGLEEFQDKMAEECNKTCNFVDIPQERKRCQSKCLASVRLEEGRNDEFVTFVHQALDEITKKQEERTGTLQPSF